MRDILLIYWENHRAKSLVAENILLPFLTATLRLVGDDHRRASIYANGNA